MSLMDLPNLTSATTLLATLGLIFYLWAKYKQTYWSRRGIGSPPAHWLFGHLKDALMLKSSPPQILGDIYNDPAIADKPVVGVYCMQKPFLLLRKPELIKQVLGKDFHCFSDRYFAAKRKTDIIGSASIFAIDNPEWKYLRTKLAPAFSSAKQKGFFLLMLESADSMRQYLEAKVPADGRVLDFDARSLCDRYTTNVIASLSFGIKTNCFQEPDIEFYTRTRDIYELTITRHFTLFFNFFFPKLNDYFGGSTFNKHTEYFRNTFWESMNEREKSGKKRDDIIDVLLALKNAKQDAEFKFEGDYLVAQSGIFFIAGLESSAVTMAFALMELARNPEIQKKVRDEIREKIGSEAISYEVISNMTYLNQVVHETLRLYPPAPLLDRVALRDYKMPDSDIVIEKGTVVYVALKGLHKDPVHHPDPEKFDPDRFSEKRKQDMKQCTFMPFGDGPRMCIGNRVGLMQTKIGMITILRNYEVIPNPEFKNEESKRGIFLAPANGIHVYFKKSPNGLITFLISTSSIIILSLATLRIQNGKRKERKIEEEKRLQEKILSSPKLSWMKVGTVKDVVYYPLKSGKGKSVEQCEFGPYGIVKNESGVFSLSDRMFIVYDEKTGKFQTGRQFAKLLLVSISAVDENRAQLEVENMPTLIFNLPRSTDKNAKVNKCFMWWGEPIQCLDCGSEVSQWFSKFLTKDETKLRLGMAVFDTHRKVTEGVWNEHAKIYSTMRDEDTGKFSDLASYTLMSEASVNDLNSRLKKSVPPSQFRQNVIVKDCEPYAEDQWEWIKIGSQVVLRNFKLCTRCTMIRIDPETGIPDSQNEPLKTLRTYRKLKNVEMDKLENHAPSIGIYCGLYRNGEVHVGDDVFAYRSNDVLTELHKSE